ncbi:twin-arginine translocation signal domain-containing protein [Leptolyngbya sp. 7M]|uniref:twin-arginine translocation signal domain-containing protein n=1 Tax=Leptolyngbya sp. 7M TaxID=2812896 RepID=UPI001B8AE791|nr:twin-arginine translocation signal domain-containing protein [Leptolyngbya sp. 7M]QYO63709.1 twin-arginine translocation signal domain-containing protein [Leptolyngbya sp. 7M]
MAHQNSPNSDSSFPSIHQSRRHPTRRRFLQFSAAALSTVALSNCARNTLNQQSTASSPVAQTDSKTLYLYTWADYSSNELYQRFRDQTGIQVVADVYDSMAHVRLPATRSSHSPQRSDR